MAVLVTLLPINMSYFVLAFQSVKQLMQLNMYNFVLFFKSFCSLSTLKNKVLFQSMFKATLRSKCVAAISKL